MTTPSKPSNTPKTAPDATIEQSELSRLLDGTHHNPHGILGAHTSGEFTILRTLKPDAVSVSAVIGGVDHPLTHQDSGLFVATVPYPELIDYRYRVTYRDA